MSEPRAVAGRYTLVRRIGAGAMGTVWLARDETLRREVAIKQITDRAFRTDREAQTASARAMREGRMVARLNHPNVVTIFDVVRHDNQPWLVMEYVPSKTLNEVVRADGGLPEQRVASIGAQLAGALAEAHRVGVVHRDVKPGNVLLADSDVAKLTDFGIARGGAGDTLTETGLLAGTPAYFAPEIARGADPAPQSDVWSLGATLYYAVEGRAPFGSDGNPLAVLGRIATQDVPPPARAGRLAPVLSRLLTRDPAGRPTMSEAARLLAAVPTPRAAPLATPAVRPTKAPATRPTPRPAPPRQPDQRPPDPRQPHPRPPDPRQPHLTAPPEDRTPPPTSADVPPPARTSPPALPSISLPPIVPPALPPILPPTAPGGATPPDRSANLSWLKWATPADPAPPATHSWAKPQPPTPSEPEGRDANTPQAEPPKPEPAPTNSPTPEPLAAASPATAPPAASPAPTTPNAAPTAVGPSATGSSAVRSSAAEPSAAEPSAAGAFVADSGGRPPAGGGPAAGGAAARGGRGTDDGEGGSREVADAEVARGDAPGVRAGGSGAGADRSAATAGSEAGTPAEEAQAVEAAADTASEPTSTVALPRTPARGKRPKKTAKATPAKAATAEPVADKAPRMPADPTPDRQAGAEVSTPAGPTRGAEAGTADPAPQEETATQPIADDTARTPADQADADPVAAPATAPRTPTDPAPDRETVAEPGANDTTLRDITPSTVDTPPPATPAVTDFSRTADSNGRVAPLADLLAAREAVNAAAREAVLPAPPIRVPRPPRRDGRAAWLVAAVLLVVFIVAAIWYLLRPDGEPATTGQPNPTTSAPRASSGKPPSSKPASTPPRTGTSNPASSNPATSNPTSKPANPMTAAAMTTFVGDYYRLLPANTEEGWKRLGPRLKQIGHDSYTHFWATIAQVSIADLTADPAAATVTGTVTFLGKNGDRSVERHRFSMITTDDGAGLLINVDTLLR